MNIELTNDKLISLILSVKVPILEIRNKIINEKNKLELNDTYKYHIERWETISSKYFKCLEYISFEPSDLYDNCYSENSLAYPDYNLDFYLETGISYQIRELVLWLIVNHTENITDDEIKEWRKIDDIMYGVVGKLIMDEMK